MANMLCNIVKFINDAIGCDPLTVTQQVSTQGFDKNALCDALNTFYTANCGGGEPSCTPTGGTCVVTSDCCSPNVCDPIDQTCQVIPE